MHTCCYLQYHAHSSLSQKGKMTDELIVTLTYTVFNILSHKHARPFTHMSIMHLFTHKNTLTKSLTHKTKSFSLTYADSHFYFHKIRWSQRSLLMCSFVHEPAHTYKCSHSHTHKYNHTLTCLKMNAHALTASLQIY